MAGRVTQLRMDSPIHIYRATAGDCKSCPIHQQCTRGTQRSLSVPFDENTRQEVMALQNTEAFQHLRRLREKVEMLFARMNQQFRITRLRLRALAGAAEELFIGGDCSKSTSPCTAPDACDR
jgi:Transposase DDE domain